MVPLGSISKARVAIGASVSNTSHSVSARRNIAAGLARRTETGA